MSDASPDLTLDELRERIKKAGVPIPAARHEMIRGLLSNALRPGRAADWRAQKTLEPAVTFDAAQTGGDHAKR